MEVDTPDVWMGSGADVEATRFDVYKLLKAAPATRWPAPRLRRQPGRDL